MLRGKLMEIHNERKLVKISYYRNKNKDDIKTAVITEKQMYDIRTLRPHIHIINVISVPNDSERDYVLY